MQHYLEKISQAKTTEALESLRIELLGKKGVLTEQMKSLGSLDPEERKKVGQELNIQKQALENALDSKKQTLELAEINKKLASEKLDLTLPVNQGISTGSLHPLTHVIMEISTIFAKLGFELAEGPDIEDVFHNFDALNIPAHHPARERNASFYLADSENMLRTETSTVQIRKMIKDGAPVKIFAPGRAYRYDLDATHVPMFHQCEGLLVGENITLANLFSVTTNFLKSFFEADNAPVRVRQHFFPFTEPSFEIDVRYKEENGVWKIGKDGNKWTEIYCCGMVHPNVLKNCGIDPEKYQGFAFGIGIERLIMAKYGISDMRKLFEGDIRFLKHYGFPANETPNHAEGLS
ncbi:MAG: phenylalanine--tRNA ligase subunit alpha [Alphaproteobacteria bacterium]|nr:phenylalanine--tRNA ligase subunit alpha [Alphaproteobacteria bacterium]